MDGMSIVKTLLFVIAERSRGKKLMITMIVMKCLQRSVLSSWARATGREAEHRLDLWILHH